MVEIKQTNKQEASDAINKAHHQNIDDVIVKNYDFASNENARTFFIAFGKSLNRFVLLERVNQSMCYCW